MLHCLLIPLISPSFLSPSPCRKRKWIFVRGSPFVLDPAFKPFTISSISDLKFFVLFFVEVLGFLCNLKVWIHLLHRQIYSLFVVWIFEHVSILKLRLSICGESVVLFAGHEIIFFFFPTFCSLLRDPSYFASLGTTVHKTAWTCTTFCELSKEW